MKKIILMFIPLVYLSMIACNSTPPATPPPSPAADTKGEDQKAVVTKFLSAVQTGDMTTANNQLAEDFMSYGPSLKDSLNRTQFIEHWTNRWEAEFDSIGYIHYAQIAVTVDSMDWVNNWGHISAKFKNGSPDIHFNYHGSFRMKGDKIVQYIAFYNVADILEQQGFTFVPPAKKQEKKK